MMETSSEMMKVWKINNLQAPKSEELVHAGKIYLYQKPTLMSQSAKNESFFHALLFLLFDFSVGP